MRNAPNASIIRACNAVAINTVSKDGPMPGSDQVAPPENRAANP